MLIITLFFLASFLAFGDDSLVFGESYRTLKNDGAYQTNILWAQKDIGKRVGMFGWAQYGTGYQQTYGGLFVKPTSWLQLGAGTGEEERSTHPRLGTFLYASKGRLSSFAIYEDAGATGYWYLFLTDMRLNKWWSVGSHSQAFFGHGPRAELRIFQKGNWTYSIRPAIGWSRGTGLRPNAIVGLRLTYFKGE